MNKKKLKLIHEGNYVIEVEINLFYESEGWSPYLSLDDALKLDNAREALQKGDLQTASKLGKVYKLVPVAV
ncbi:MAG: hypothetical protein H7A23_24210 [Leptospiraceae bacterium]|nr:hypothetical protein [Leptospiraceae bacterium]MCP5497669.1 hypothetical protein [Leptospiraceae bacterium]